MTNDHTITNPTISAATTAVPGKRRWRRTVARWMVSFAGYPLGGAAAILLTGRVDSLASALASGLVAGAVLGAVQAWALGGRGPRPLAWVVATAVGMMAGLGLGALVVDFRTGLADLVVQGLVSGALVGAAQAVTLVPRLGRIAVAWPFLLSAVWAVGWAVTTSAGIRVGEQFTVFGSSGALVATALTVVLPLLLERRRHESERSAS